jgi:hypothetical protein
MMRVTWQIDLPAATPVEAARKALAIQRSPESLATVFTVRLADGTEVTVDLAESRGPE